MRKYRGETHRGETALTRASRRHHRGRRSTTRKWVRRCASRRRRASPRRRSPAASAPSRCGRPAKLRDPALLPIAAFPALFAVQQTRRGPALARSRAAGARRLPAVPDACLHRLCGSVLAGVRAARGLADRAGAVAPAADRRLRAHRRRALDLPAVEDDRQSLHGVGRDRAHRLQQRRDLSDAGSKFPTCSRRRSRCCCRRTA